MARATKIKNIHILRRNGRWTAVWQGRRACVVRHSVTPEHALISLLASEVLEPNKMALWAAHSAFIVWLEMTGLMGLRQALVHAKGYGWNRQRMEESVRIYREWRREQTGGTSLGLGE